MEALRLKTTTANGRLTVVVPELFNNKEVEIIVLPAEENDDNKEAYNVNMKENEERLKRLLSIIGTAKYPDTAIDKYDAYNQ